MQNVYITRNEKQIQLTVDEIKSAWDAWEAELRKKKLDAYIEEVKQTLLKFYKEEVKQKLLRLSKEKDDPEYEMAANNQDIIDEIARDIGRTIAHPVDPYWADYLWDDYDWYDYDWETYNWCFTCKPDACGGFMHCYEDAMRALREKDKMKDKIKQTLLKLSKENDDPKYEMAANNKDIIDEIAREIGRAIENEDDYDYDGDFYDWCFNPGAYGGFMHCYESAMIVLREKDKIKQTLLKLSKENDNPKYEMAANNKDIIDKIARKIGRAIENGSDYDWCFNPGAYGGFMHCYKSAMRALREKDDINENY